MSRTQLFRSAAAATAIALAGCSVPEPPAIGALQEPELAFLTQIAPPGAEPGTCWGKTVTPAIIETVTEQVMIQPAEVRSDGSVLSPAVFKTETRQQILRERRETWFQTPCVEDMTPDFIASLQRALRARALYRGEISGVMDARTRASVRRLQEPQGLDSGILSLAAARQLGLLVDPRFARPEE